LVDPDLYEAGEVGFASVVSEGHVGVAQDIAFEVADTIDLDYVPG
jgi:hypothetical protein